MRNDTATMFLSFLLLVPAGVCAEEFSPDNFAPISPIFIRDEQPEWANDHSTMKSWDGHRAYHSSMREQLSNWKTQWERKTGTAEYIAAERELIKTIQRDHRMVHQALNRTDRNIFSPTQNNIKTGRAAIITVLPKRSPRLMRREVMLRESR